MLASSAELKRSTKFSFCTVHHNQTENKNKEHNIHMSPFSYMLGQISDMRHVHSMNIRVNSFQHSGNDLL